MSASLIALALAAQQIVVPLGGAKAAPKYPAPLATAGPAFARACEGRDGWDDAAPPVRVHGNTYYVGTCGITALLLTSKDGHALIDSGTEVGADLVAANIRKLGFKPTDVKWIVHSHEHHDHVGGFERIRALTGGDVVASAGAAPVLRTGIIPASDPQSGILPKMAPVPVARVVRNGDTLRLGGILLKAIETPGHTAGALSWQWVSCDGGVCRTMVYADSMSPVSRDDYKFSAHPDLIATFRASFAKVAALECDIVLTPHPSASNMTARFAGKAALFDPAGCRNYAAAKTKGLNERLAKEAAAK
ncbi:metallo-beta-lactamase class B [Sphingomonas kaistensis]|uniref:Metallo-beta-lactamase class B n=1 Tax=Sphingomonas kaistensis TaxID=298708 RepID=A0A7X5Y829_9SPHN|nr:subclass B3 metallo-beta-lactamase [Sphingomonas kaistensis]NJC05246.1 metallo-beta-lactamase class B [Sphingomonas kaistensis]